MRLPDGREMIVKITDLSLSVAGVEPDLRPELCARIVLGAILVVIAGHYAGGLGVEFEHPFWLGELE